MIAIDTTDETNSVAEAMSAFLRGLEDIAYIHNVSAPAIKLRDCGIEPVVCRYQFNLIDISDQLVARGYLISKRAGQWIVTAPDGEDIMIFDGSVVKVTQSTELTYMVVHGFSINLRIRKEYL